ncbi:hypothetical protein QN277_023403 [Acacia crassicarpa]|uniref:C2H2-type domain-containing protein n=1 Tax=Acacia crassicarpa TaxID=499986 RepID=A0AAE1JK27_9FABA|nr:hypothetical protein QN277_023403 [Acacia crassicarpa]
MEFGLKNKDKSERIRWGYSSEEATQVRSYTCAFCQKGFSNAQALGGHMNIHRRDRARLRQQYSLDTNPNNDLHHQNPDDDINHKKPSIFPEAKVNMGISSEISSQLPIFFGVEEKMELDLELRLGPEPVKQTPPILRRFF